MFIMNTSESFMTNFFNRGRCVSILSALLLLAALVGAVPVSAEQTDSSDELLQLPLEDLLKLEVTSVSRKSQSLANAAAAVFVISQEDIRRSGVTNIPDALRMVPGVTVARIDSSKWAVTVRGFNGRFVRKLLVLVDGRSAYSQLFAGVFWDTQDIMLEDIDRIEVIRGPGATLWGANAMNGVINIITKKATETEGGLLTAGAGSYERVFGGARYGMQLGESGAVRAYGKYFNRDEQKTMTGQNADDAWEQVRGGFRFDNKAGDNTYTLQGDVYTGTERETYQLADLSNAPSFSSTRTHDTVARGGNLLGRWTRTLSEDSDLSLQMYFDNTLRKMLVVADNRNTYDFDLQHRFSLFKAHDIIWGAGFRYSSDSIGNDGDNLQILSLTPNSRAERLYSAFVQDDITLLQDRLHLIIGSKFEHNVYTGFEVQPSGRLIFTPSERTSLWASVARAVHTPSRGESDVFLKQAAMPLTIMTPFGPQVIPLLATIQGPGNLKAEELMAYEAGVRFRPLDRLSVDITGFYNNYDRLVGIETSAPTGPTPDQPFILVTNTLRNNRNGETWGAELAADWRVMDFWRLAGTYSYIHATTNAGEKPPNHQASLRSQWDLTSSVEFDLWGRYVDQSEDFLQLPIASYITMDARLGWRPIRNLELSLAGRNLLHDKVQEFRPEFLSTQPSATGREISGKVTWRF
jgi:iron complex outermembrane recepter protein